MTTTDTQPKLDPTVKADWLAALRSGEYAQTSGALCRTRTRSDTRTAGFCCLGVLSDLYAKAHPDLARWVDGLDPNDDTRSLFEVTRPDGSTDTEGAYLSPVVAAWAGLGGCTQPLVEAADEAAPVDGACGNPDCRVCGPYISLAVLNDQPTPFATIADLIEASL